MTIFEYKVNYMINSEYILTISNEEYVFLFQKNLVCSYRLKLQIEIQSDSDSTIPQENLDTAIKFGMEKIDATDIKKYVVAFLRKLLLQREKHSGHLLENYINREIEKQWQEVLSCLEDRNRKFINIKSGSFVLTLFCPTRESRLQLQHENWRIEIQQKIAELLKLLGKRYYTEVINLFYKCIILLWKTSNSICLLWLKCRT